MPGIDQSRVNALHGLDDVERIHVHLAERRPIVSKRTVADGRSWNGSEPAVEYGEFQRQFGQHRHLALLEVVHDSLRVAHVFLLIEVALDEALHGSNTAGAGVATKYLKID